MRKADKVKIHIGKEIEKRRKELNINQEDIAAYLDCSRVNISNMERGISNTTTQCLWMVCNALHCTPNDLFTVTKPAKTRYKTKIKTVITRTKVLIKVPTI